MARKEYSVNSKDLMEFVRNLVKQGNVRKIIIKDSSGKKLMDFSLTAGIIGLMLAPMLAAISALTGYAANFKVEVVHNDDGKEEATHKQEDASL